MEVRNFRISDTFQLGLDERAVCREEDLDISIGEIMVEEIAPSGDYPAGSGLDISLHVRWREKETDLAFSSLSRGYGSVTEKEWGGFRFSLEGADEKKIRLKVICI